jgi:hypothetical protein
MLLVSETILQLASLMTMSTKYRFIIDTDVYAGNFEREMCAFLTGQIGECTVGEEIASEFEKRFPIEFTEFENIIGHFVDEHGVFRPVEIDESPSVKGKYPQCNSVSIAFSEKPAKGLIKFMIERANEFAKQNFQFIKANSIKIKGFRLKTITQKVKYQDIKI